MTRDEPLLVPVSVPVSLRFCQNHNSDDDDDDRRRSEPPFVDYITTIPLLWTLWQLCRAPTVQQCVRLGAADAGQNASSRPARDAVGTSTNSRKEQRSTHQQRLLTRVHHLPNVASTTDGRMIRKYLETTYAYLMITTTTSVAAAAANTVKKKGSRVSPASSCGIVANDRKQVLTTENNSYNVQEQRRRRERHTSATGRPVPERRTDRKE